MTNRFVFFLIFCFFAISLNAQKQNNIELLYLNGNHIPQKGIFFFEYIDYQMDIRDATMVAEFKLMIEKQGKKGLIPTFYEFWKKSNLLGANAFSLDSITFENNTYILYSSIYYLTEKEMAVNYSFYDENIVVVFGNLDTKKINKPTSCKVNGKNVEIYPYSYNMFQNGVGEELKISKGGFLGASVSVLGEDYKLASCFSLGGLGVSPSVGVAYGNRGAATGVGIRVQTASIIPVELNLALYLMTILDNAGGNELCKNNEGVPIHI